MEAAHAHRNIAAGSDDHAQHAGLHQPRARGLNHRVAAARVHVQSLGQSRFRGSLRRYAARERGRFHRFRENRLVQPGERNQSVGPHAVLRVKEAGAGRFGHVGQHPPRQPEADVILRAAENLHPREILRLLVAQPEKLAAGIAGEHAVIRVAQKSFHAARAPGNPVALLLRALVAPQNRGTNHAHFSVQRHKTVHLAGERHAANVLRVRARLRQHGSNAVRRTAPPVLRVLLRPAGTGRGKRILPCRRGDHPPRLVGKQALRAGRSNVKTDQHPPGHVSSSCF